jgi:hypothetical protein
VSEQGVEAVSPPTVGAAGAVIAPGAGGKVKQESESKLIRDEPSGGDFQNSGRPPAVIVSVVGLGPVGSSVTVGGPGQVARADPLTTAATVRTKAAIPTRKNLLIALPPHSSKPGTVAQS